MLNQALNYIGFNRFLWCQYHFICSSLS